MHKVKINPFTFISSRTGLALGLSLLAFSSDAALISVPGDYSTIQEAVTAADPGDQITVSEGIYEENVTIDKSLFLLSDRARIDAYNYDAAITIAADDVRVSGFDIRTGDNSALYALEVGGLMVDSCQMHGGDIRLEMSKGATISNCFSGGAFFGIYSMGNGFMGGTSDVITDCQIYAAYVGIEVSYADVPVIVRSNFVSNCGIGIDVGDSADVSLTGNSVYVSVDELEPLRVWSEFLDSGVALNGNNVFALEGYPTPNVAALKLINVTETNILNVTGHFNRFGASNAVSVSGSGPITANLTNNWWGKNSAPTSDVSVAPWLIMSVSPQTVTATNGFVTITCNWFTNSASQNVSSLGLLPDSRDGLYMADSSGYLVDPILDNRVPMQITGGTSSVLYYPSVNPGTVTCTLDYQTIPVLFNQ